MDLTATETDLVALYRANGWELRRVAKQKHEARLGLWHTAVFAADAAAAVRVAECGGKGLGLVARRDLDNTDVRALTLQFQACSETVFAHHPSRFQQAIAGERRAWAFCTAWPTVVVISVLERVNASFFTGGRRAGRELLADYWW